MENNQALITLYFVRNDGRREKATLRHQSLSEAHQAAEDMLRKGAGLYTEVEICAEGGDTETIRENDVATSRSG